MQFKKERSSHGWGDPAVPRALPGPWGCPTLPRSSTRATSHAPQPCRACHAPRPGLALPYPHSQEGPDVLGLDTWSWHCPAVGLVGLDRPWLLMPCCSQSPEHPQRWLMILPAVTTGTVCLGASECSILDFSFGGRGRSLHHYLGTDSWLW